MDLWSALQDAFRALRQNRMRSALTMVGITIGVAAVICTVAIGQGGQTKIQEQFQNIGDNLVWIMAGSRNVGGVRTGTFGTSTLLPGDEKAIAELPLIRACSPNVDSYIQVTHRDRNWWTHYRGIAPAFLEIQHWTVAKGRPFTDSDIRNMAKDCVLGKTVADHLFSNGEDPVGETVRIDNLPFTVIGVLAAKGLTPVGADQDDILMMPYTVAMKEVMGHYWLNDIFCSAVSYREIPHAQSMIVKLLRLRHNLRPDEPDDFYVAKPYEVLESLRQANTTFSLMLASIASVSLLVGGIGIMNIMLVSVTERTREIGIRKAIGATRGDVRKQFLIESVALGLFGGGAGVALGVVSTRVLTQLLAWPVTLSAEAVVVALVVSIVTGIFFGYYPASRAAALNPIDAIRHE